MKGIVRRLVFYTISLFITSLLLSGVKIFGGIESYVIAGVVLTIMMFALRPILQIISFPLNALTFGFFSFVVNAIILFVLTIFITQISISAFTFPKLTILGFSSPAIELNRWFAFLVASLVLSGVYSFLTWLTTE